VQLKYYKMNKQENPQIVADSELQEFCQWYKGHYGKAESFESVMITCLCGRFHTYPKEAKKLMERLKGLDLLSQKRNIVYLK
jgi:DNA mismatch repair ATPase MutS